MTDSFREREARVPVRRGMIGRSRWDSVVGPGKAISVVSDASFNGVSAVLADLKMSRLKTGVGLEDWGGGMIVRSDCRLDLKS